MTSELNDLKREFCWAEQYSDFDKLEELSDKMLEIDPNLTEYKKQLISLYFYADEYEKCVKKYNRYIREFGEINDEDFDYFMALSYLQLDEWPKAYPFIDKLDYEKTSELWMEYYFVTENYPRAKAIGDSILEQNCENYDVLRNMSQICHITGDDERALFYEYESVKLYPELLSGHIINLFNMGRYDELIDKFEENKDQLLDELNSPYFNFIIGASYNRLERYYDSLKYLYKSNQLDENNDIKLLIAKNYFLLHDYKMAHKFLLSILKTDKNNIIALRYIGECLLYMGNFIEAIDYLNKALIIDKEYDAPWLIIAAYYLETGELEKARNTLRFISYESDESDIYIFEIGRNLSIIGKYDRAIKYFDAFIELIPDAPFSYVYRADHYKRIGDDELFNRDMKKFEELTSEQFRQSDEVFGQLYNELKKKSNIKTK